MKSLCVKGVVGLNRAVAPAVLYVRGGSGSVAALVDARRRLNGRCGAVPGRKGFGGGAGASQGFSPLSRRLRLER